MTRPARPLGSRNGNATLSVEDVHTIREAQGAVSARELADYYGLSIETVRRIWRRESWNWLPVRKPAEASAPPSPLDEAAESARRVLDQLRGDKSGNE